MYYTIRTSPIGCDYPMEVFLRTPLRTIQWLLRRIKEEVIIRENRVAKPTVNLLDTVEMGIRVFAGVKDGKPLDLNKYLPHPHWFDDLPPEDDEEESNNTTITKETKEILVKLLEEHRIPAFVYSTLITPPSGA